MEPKMKRRGEVTTEFDKPIPEDVLWTIEFLGGDNQELPPEDFDRVEPWDIDETSSVYAGIIYIPKEEVDYVKEHVEDWDYLIHDEDGWSIYPKGGRSDHGILVFMGMLGEHLDHLPTFQYALDLLPQYPRGFEMFDIETLRKNEARREAFRAQCKAEEEAKAKAEAEAQA
ncbi:MAG: hypothetical protein Q4P72_02120 [Eubacteriales bacterium]|nr:hypothetical protein [Eubacteriales bacterium]